jgi:hypothetical protein
MGKSKVKLSIWTLRSVTSACGADKFWVYCTRWRKTHDSKSRRIQIRFNWLHHRQTLDVKTETQEEACLTFLI